MIRELVVFPINSDVMPIIRYAEQYGFHIKNVVSPKALGYHGRDAGFIDGGSPLNLVVNNHLTVDISESDFLYLGFDPIVRQEDYVKIANIFTRSGCTIYADNRLKYLRALFDDINYLGENIVEPSDSRYLCMINIPTILVMGAGEETNKFDIQLHLRAYLKNKGYDVLQFGTKRYASLFSIMPLPDFMYGELSYEKKILSFNAYLKNCLSRRRSDVLIIGVPGGIGRTSLKQPNHFGELSFVISNAVNADICVMSLYNDQYRYENFVKIQDKIRNCFNINRTYIHVSYNKFILDIENQERGVEFLTKSKSECDLKTGWFNVNNFVQSKKLLDELLSEFVYAKHVVR